MKCKRCKRTAIYDGYCKRCFVELTERRIAKLIMHNQLVRNNDHILIALSGGADSSLVAYYISQIHAKRARNLKLTAVTIAVPGSKQEANAAKICKLYGITHLKKSFEDFFDKSWKDIVLNISKKEKMHPCSVCGVLKRRALDLTAKEIGAKKIATGHNLTDEAVSFLMSFVLGNLKAMAHLGPISTPIRPEFIPRIKILRSLPNSDVRAYCKLKKIPFIATPCPYRVGCTREAFEGLLEEMKEKKPDADFSIVKTGDFFAGLLRRKWGSEGMELRQCKICGEFSSSDVCRVCHYLRPEKV